MSIARGSTLKNAYRYVTLAIDSCSEKQLCGMIFHEAREKGIPFSGYLELAWTADAILQGRDYPMRSVEQRTFLKAKSHNMRHEWTPPELDVQRQKKGKKATFQLFIKHRFYASWQGTLFWVENQQTFKYQSFLELMHLMNELLTDKVAEPILESHIEFGNMDQLVEQLDTVLCLQDSGLKTAIGLYRKDDKTATFVIRFLFRENATCQGSIRWKETGIQRHFRSFLELIMMVDEGIGGSIRWIQPDMKESAIAL